MLAGVAAGFFADLSEAVAQTVSVADAAVEPRPQNAGVYAEAYGAYRALFDGVEGALT
jgi:ribulose kinase